MNRPMLASRCNRTAAGNPTQARRLPQAWRQANAYQARCGHCRFRARMFEPGAHRCRRLHSATANRDRGSSADPPSRESQSKLARCLVAAAGSGAEPHEPGAGHRAVHAGLDGGAFCRSCPPLRRHAFGGRASPAPARSARAAAIHARATLMGHSGLPVHECGERRAP